MGYRYEIFLSYPRRPMVMRWLDKLFEPLFSDLLREELLARRHELPGGQLRIFRDNRDIGAGENWPRALKEAARDSRCALAILLPSYFASKYCLAEWKTFQIRGKEFQRDLLIPVRFHDCHHLVEEAFDLSKYTAIVENTPRWAEFHDRVVQLAGQVAERIMSAPPFPDDPERATWLSSDSPQVSAVLSDESMVSASTVAACLEPVVANRTRPGSPAKVPITSAPRVEVPRMQVFLSYNQADEAFVRRVAEELIHAGLHPWFAIWKMGPGDLLAPTLERAIGSCDCFILFWSSNSKEAKWVDWERQNADQLRGKRRICIRLDRIVPPPELSQRIWLDWLDSDRGDAFDTKMKVLIRSIYGQPFEDPPAPLR